MSDTSIRKLTELLLADAKSHDPAYPDQALPALANKRLRRLLEERFENGENLVAVETPPRHSETGLIPVRFDFQVGGAVQLRSTAVLAMMNAECRIIGIDPDHRPPDAPAPFALATAGEPEVIDAETIEIMESRERDFVQRRGLLSGFSARDDESTDSDGDREDQDTFCLETETVSSTCLRGFDGGFGGWPTLTVRVNDDQKSIARSVVDDTLPAEDIGDILGGWF